MRVQPRITGSVALTDGFDKTRRWYRKGRIE